MIFFAYSIALLHTAVPHTHGQARADEYAISRTGCITESSSGFLQKVLSTDLGIGHLETFQKGSEADIESFTTFTWMIAPATSCVAFFTPVKINSELSQGYIEKLKRKRLLFSVSHFRAPPAC